MTDRAPSLGGGGRPRLILLTQWFDPEPTFKGLLFAKALAAHGYDVEVVTGFPNYPGGKLYPGYRIRLCHRSHADGIAVTRLALYPSHDKGVLGRIANYVSFFLTAMTYLGFVARRADVVYAYHPPLTVGLAAALAKLIRRTPTVIDMQDMWPDTLAATGMIGNRRLLAIISWLCDWLYRRVTHIVVLSPGFKRLLIERSVPAAMITVIPNWADAAAVARTDAATPKAMVASGRFRVLFAGNMGRAQALATVLDAAAQLAASHPEVEFVMLGGGLEVPDLRAAAAERSLSNVTFLPPVPMAEVGAYLQAADALLVHLRDDPLFAITIPSKTQAYLAAGKPIIMAVTGDAADMVTASGGGLVIPPENAEALAEAVRQLAAMSSAEHAAMGTRGRAYYKAELSIERGVGAFDALFRRVMA